MKRLKDEATTAFLTFCGSGLTVAVGANTRGYLDLRNVSFTKIFEVKRYVFLQDLCVERNRQS